MANIKYEKSYLHRGRRIQFVIGMVFVDIDGIIKFRECTLNAYDHKCLWSLFGAAIAL